MKQSRRFRIKKLYPGSIKIEEHYLSYRGFLECILCYKNGFLHRTDGPAVVGWDYVGEWYQNGIHHRRDDCELISYLFAGHPISKELHDLIFEDTLETNLEVFKELIKVIRWLSIAMASDYHIRFIRKILSKKSLLKKIDNLMLLA